MLDFQICAVWISIQYGPFVFRGVSSPVMPFIGALALGDFFDSAGRRFGIWMLWFMFVWVFVVVFCAVVFAGDRLVPSAASLVCVEIYFLSSSATECHNFKEHLRGGFRQPGPVGLLSMAFLSLVCWRTAALVDVASPGHGGGLVVGEEQLLGCGLGTVASWLWVMFYRPFRGLSYGPICLFYLLVVVLLCNWAPLWSPPLFF